MDFISSVNSGMILCLRGGLRNSELLLGASVDEISTKKKTSTNKENNKPSNGTTAIRTPSPIGITKSNYQVQPRISLKKEAMICYALQFPKNTLDSKQVRGTGNMHKLEDYMYSVSNINPSYGKIL